MYLYRVTIYVSSESEMSSTPQTTWFEVHTK